MGILLAVLIASCTTNSDRRNEQRDRLLDTVRSRSEARRAQLGDNPFAALGEAYSLQEHARAHQDSAILLLALQSRHVKTRALALSEEQRRIIEQKSVQLAESNSLRELLLDIVTHDVLNPFSAIQSAAEVLKLRPDNQRMLDIIISSSTHAEITHYFYNEDTDSDSMIRSDRRALVSAPGPMRLHMRRFKGAAIE